MAEVQRVLSEIGAGDIPQLLVFNKLDQVEPAQRPHGVQDVYDLAGVPTPRIFLSAQSGDGVAMLRQMLVDKIQGSAAAPVLLPDFHASHEADPGFGTMESK
jgi:GTP-binding protein HflX